MTAHPESFTFFSREHDGYISLSPETHIDTAPVDYDRLTERWERDDLGNPLENHVTESMYAQGIDMQGLDWTQHCTRESLRKRRMKDYVTYMSVKGNIDEETTTKRVPDNTKSVTPDTFYTFKHGCQREKCTIGHFQLRNLVSATSKNSVYYLRNDVVCQWSPQRMNSRDILDVSPANIQNDTMKISSMASAHNVLLIGGFIGEYALKRLDGSMDAPIHYGHTTDQSNGIANHLQIVTDRRGGVKGIMASNDMHIRFIDLATMTVDTTFTFKFPINCSAASPDKQMLCAVGDSTMAVVVDAKTGKHIMTMDEHDDFSFACAWRPDGRLVATGNQDKTTRVYDVRMPSTALHVLNAHVGAIRSLHFSNDGKYLLAAEPIDFVHLYDTSDFRASQVIDMFGDIAGAAFTPDDSALFIANADKRVGGIYEFQRLREDMIWFEAASFYI